MGYPHMDLSNSDPWETDLSPSPSQFPWIRIDPWVDLWRALSMAHKFRRDAERHEQILREELQMLRLDHTQFSEITQATFDSVNRQSDIKINTNDMETSIDLNSNPEAWINEQPVIANITSTSHNVKDPESAPKGPPILAKDLFTEPATCIWWGDTEWKDSQRCHQKTKPQDQPQKWNHQKVKAQRKEDPHKCQRTDAVGEIKETLLMEENQGNQPLRTGETYHWEDPIMEETPMGHCLTGEGEEVGKKTLAKTTGRWKQQQIT